MMNKRIRALAVEAMTYVTHNPKANKLNSGDMFDEKFAQLIIAHATECVRDVLRDEDSDLTYPAATQVQNHIKQYFGVEY